jgi:hypothetical protein
MKKMKMYVWADPYEVRYGSSCCIAVAESLEQAKEVAKSGKSYSSSVYELDSHLQVELGEPTRIIDLPCAEWNKWEE